MAAGEVRSPAPIGTLRVLTGQSCKKREVVIKVSFLAHLHRARGLV